MPPLRVLALVKQIPGFESMELGADGRLVRTDLPLEMSAYCRRAVAESVELVEQFGGDVTVVTLGPPSADDVLREAIAYGTQHDVAITGVHVSDPAFAGSDTLATARALQAAVEQLQRDAGRPFDLVLCGRNSVDADTGQVGPELAQLLDLPFATGIKEVELAVDGDRGPVAIVGCEHDDQWVEATVALPAVLSTAERLIDPCKIQDPAVWATVDPALIRRIDAAELGPGPWGAAASPTSVGETRSDAVRRAGVVLEGTIAEQVGAAIAFLDDRGALVPGSPHATSPDDLPDRSPLAGRSGPVIGVVVEPWRGRLASELLGVAARLAAEIDGTVVALGPNPLVPTDLAARGADAVVGIDGAEAEEDVAVAVTAWARQVAPWAILAGSTSWGREVAARAAAALGAGLTGDAVGLAVDDGRLLAWKPAFGGSLVAAIHTSSPIQLATVRSGVLPLHRPREVVDEPIADTIEVAPRRRAVTTTRRVEDDGAALLTAEMVVGVGKGVDPARYGELDGLRALLGAELAATRKVTDNGWLPRARQIGITGHSISPRLYVAIALGGKFNHLVGVRSAGTILAINTDPEAPVFAASDIGIVAPWDEAVPELERQLRDLHS
jgi:electron transfer flavoprotein alpha subunit